MDEAAGIFRFLQTARGGADPEIVESMPVDPATWGHPAVESGQVEGAPALVIRPVDVAEFPSVPEFLVPWISGDVDRPAMPPRLRAKATFPGERGASAPARISDHPEIREAWTRWQAQWQAWSRTDQQDRPVAALRAWLLRVGDALARDPGLDLSLSLVQTAGVSDDRLRHVAVGPLVPRLEGDALVLQGPAVLGGARLDLDALGWIDADADTRARMRDVAESAWATLRPWGEGAAEELAEVMRTAAAPDQEIFTEPRFLLRRRRLVAGSTLAHVAERLGRGGELPGAMLPLVSPHAAVPIVTSPGALVRIGDDGFCPGPLDAERVRIIDGVDRHAQTVVHARHAEPALVASLVTHLLAQGRRVLVTGPDEAALTGVRDRIPAELRTLVAATAQPDSLGPALEEVVARAGSEDDVAEAAALQARIVRLTAGRRRLLRQDADEFARSSQVHEVAGYTGTVADLATRHVADTPALGWLSAYLPLDAHDDPGADLPVPADEIRTLAAHLATPAVRDLASRFHGGTVDLDVVPSLVQMAGLVDAFDAAARAVPTSADPEHPVIRLLAAADAETRADLRELVADIAGRVAAAKQFPGQWMDRAALDVRTGRAGVWHSLLRRLDGLLTAAVEAVEDVGADITFLADVPDLVPLCEQVRRHVAAAGPITVDEHGNPRLGVDVPPGLAAAHRLAMYVRVDGRPPTTTSQVEALLRYVAAEEALDRLDVAWPSDTVWAEEVSPRERLTDHIARLRALDDLLRLDDLVASAGATLRGVGMAGVDWSDDAMIASLVVLVGDADALARADRAGAPLGEIAVRLRTLADEPGAPDAARDLAQAAADLDLAAYARAASELEHIHAHAHALTETQTLTTHVRRELPGLVGALAAAPEQGAAPGDGPAGATWTDRMDRLEDAWRHHLLGRWLATNVTPADPTARDEAIAAVDADIEACVTELATRRAWSQLPPATMAPQTRVDLMVHAHLARRLRETGGTQRQVAELARLRRRAAAAAPVWIAPLDEVPLVLDLEHDSVDVVVVLDAARVGLDGSWLRAIASRIVLFGDDDHSPSPWADAAELDAATDLLTDRPDFARWTDPTRSLFGDALKRGGTRVILDDPARTLAEALAHGSREPRSAAARLVLDALAGVDSGGTSVTDLDLVAPTGSTPTAAPQGVPADAPVPATPSPTTVELVAADVDLPGLPVDLVFISPEGGRVGVRFPRPGEDRAAAAWAATLGRSRGFDVLAVDPLAVLGAPDVTLDRIRTHCGITAHGPTAHAPTPPTAAVRVDRSPTDVPETEPVAPVTSSVPDVAPPRPRGFFGRRTTHAGARTRIR